MSEATELLAQLRDIHIPAATAEPALWPLLVTIILLFIALSWLGSALWRRKNSWALEARNAISVLQSQPPDTAVQGYAVLLKRVVLTLEPEASNKTIHGVPWLEKLDAFFNTDFFSKGEGRVFGNDIYQPVTIDKTGSRLLGNKLKQLVTRRSFSLRTRPVSKCRELLP